jgi:hypothetical protein
VYALSVTSLYLGFQVHLKFKIHLTLQPSILKGQNSQQKYQIKKFVTKKRKNIHKKMKKEKSSIQNQITQNIKFN